MRHQWLIGWLLVLQMLIGRKLENVQKSISPITRRRLQGAGAPAEADAAPSPLDSRRGHDSDTVYVWPNHLRRTRRHIYSARRPVGRPSTAWGRGSARLRRRAVVTSRSAIRPRPNMFIVCRLTRRWQPGPQRAGENSRAALQLARPH